jgi:hypothetical protein
MFVLSLQREWQLRPNESKEAVVHLFRSAPHVFSHDYMQARLVRKHLQQQQ